MASLVLDCAEMAAVTSRIVTANVKNDLIWVNKRAVIEEILIRQLRRMDGKFRKSIFINLSSARLSEEYAAPVKGCAKKAENTITFFIMLPVLLNLGEIENPYNL
jgi:hypothetical protein